jgi:zinc-binding alcohol dehydrogenase family protein
MTQIPATMQAVAYRHSLPIDDPDSLIDVELAVPTPGPHDLLVAVEAASVNPVDVKVRAGVDPAGEDKVLGYDAAGVVTAVGTEVSLFGIGDEVYYAGSIDRPGTNSAFHLVDEHIVGHKPTMLSFAEAAALPLTTITAWEGLFDRLGLTTDSTGTLLVIGAAGGAGSMVVQLARTLTDLTVIGTASRADSQAWVADLGAHYVVDHFGDLAGNVRAVAPDGVDYVFTPRSAGNIEAFADLLHPHGQIVAIDDPGAVDLMPLKSKSISWHWEFMFTAPLFTPTSSAQHDLLDATAVLVDAGTIRTTLKARLSPITAATLRQAHGLVESGRTIGKVVVARS